MIYVHGWVGLCFVVVILFVNSLRPSDAIWWQRTGSTLDHVMACCLTAPSHYLNQWWLIISKVLWLSCDGNFARDASIINHYNLFENYMSKISSKFPRGQWVNSRFMHPCSSGLLHWRWAIVWGLNYSGQARLISWLLIALCPLPSHKQLW